jgi:hypothetical protein
MTRRNQRKCFSTSTNTTSRSSTATGASNTVANVRIFLQIQRPAEPPKKCWSVPLEGMDDLGMENFERIRAQLLDEKVLKTSERICRIHVRNDGPALEGVQTEFIMRKTSSEQTEWRAMIEGLKAIFSKSPSALGLVKLQATLDVEGGDVVVVG